MNIKLPIYNKKDEIVRAVKDNDVVILSAETGSGKSTQVPQYMFEAGYNVIVTQPRRIAAVSLADRVSKEVEDSSVVGYHTAFESTKTNETKILFCTDGLQMISQVGRTLQNNTVLIIDEVHEWNLNIETLVGWVRNAMKNGMKFKVILMSATIEQDKLEYFLSKYSKTCSIHVPNRLFNVNKVYLSEHKIIDTIVDCISNNLNVLVFMSGKKEINDICDELEEKKLDAVILKMHGDLSIEEQNNCFNSYFMPKVIISTNICQTSVTIEDIDVVVDSGKEKRIEIIDNVEGLSECDISKADCEQRAGRAGRTKEGTYYLCSSTPYENRNDFNTPEIQRLTLDKIVLKLASINIDAEVFKFFHQPEEDSILLAKKLLTSLGALKDNKITEIGMRMIRIPVSVRFAKMILEAEKYGVIKDVISIVSIMEVGSLINFKHQVQERGFFDSYERKVSYKDFTNEDKSDLLAELDIYNGIKSFKYPDLTKSGLNKKNFFKIKALDEKLSKSLEYDFDVYSSTENRQDILISCLKALTDMIFYRGYDCFVNKNGVCVKLNDKSCIYSGDFFIGMPFNLEVNGYYGKTSFNILQMITSIYSNELFMLLEENDFLKEIDKYSAYYDLDSDSFSVDIRYSYLNSTVKRESITINNTDTLYKELCVINKNDVYRAKNKYVVVNGRKKEINYLSYLGKSIELSVDEVLMCKEETIKDSEGSDLRILCGGYRSTSIITLKNLVHKDFIMYLEEKYKSNFPKKTGKLDKVVDMLEYIKEIKLGELEDYSVTRFVGLYKEGGSIGLELYSNINESDYNTKESLQYVLQRKVEDKYNDKTFILRVDGKKIETKVTIKAKEDFKEYVKEIMNDINKDNFIDSLELLDSIYKELTDIFVNNDSNPIERLKNMA